MRRRTVFWRIRGLRGTQIAGWTGKIIQRQREVILARRS